MTPDKPYKTYNGGKAGNGTYQNIINHIPKIELFVDAMVGGGGIFFNLNLPALTVINDYDRSVSDKYKKFKSAKIKVTNIDAMVLIDKYGYRGPSTLIYFDPPYLKSTRKNNQDLYEIEWTMNDHVIFLDKIKNCTSNIMISHYPNHLYDQSLKKWASHTFQSITRRGMATEKIYMNYATPIILQDYRYIGKNFTDRQRIKRKVIRICEKLKNINPLERAAIITAVIDQFKNSDDIAKCDIIKSYK